MAYKKASSPSLRGYDELWRSKFDHQEKNASQDLSKLAYIMAVLVSVVTLCVLMADWYILRLIL